MSASTQMAVGSSLAIATLFVIVLFVGWIIWGIARDAYIHVRGQWMRIPNTRSDFAQSNGQFATPHAQRGTPARKQV